MNVQITVSTDKLSLALRSAVSQLSGEGATGMAKAMGVEVQNKSVDHLRGLAASRHDTANRLGAAPSGHLAQAAEKVGAASAVTTISGGGSNIAVLAINHPGMVRAFRDVTIVPTTKKFLAIPLAAIAYNRKPSQLTDEGHNMFVLRSKDSGKDRLILAEKQGDSIMPLYLLVRSVTQKQDRTLLPSDDEFSEAAVTGISNYIQQKLTEAGLL